MDAGADSKLRVVLTLASVPVVAAAAFVGITYYVEVSSDAVLVIVAFLTAMTSCWLLRSAGVSLGFALWGALAVVITSYVLVGAIIVLFLAN